MPEVEKQLRLSQNLRQVIVLLRPMLLVRNQSLLPQLYSSRTFIEEGEEVCAQVAHRKNIALLCFNDGDLWLEMFGDIKLLEPFC